MTPRQKAALRAQEILNELNGNLPDDERRELEQELGAIADNIAEGCYSNDPDDGVDWSDCPGIHGKASHIQDEKAFVTEQTQGMKMQ